MLDERADIDCQRLRKTIDVVQADVPFAALHLSHVTTIKLSPVREFFLTQPVLNPECTNACAKRLALSALLRGDFRHASTLGSCGL